MPRPADEPLRRVTLNLFEADCQWLEKEYGPGWTTRIRQHIHSLVTDRQDLLREVATYHKLRRTLGDLE